MDVAFRPGSSQLLALVSTGSVLALDTSMTSGIGPGMRDGPHLLWSTLALDQPTALAALPSALVAHDGASHVTVWPWATQEAAPPPPGACIAVDALATAVDDAPRSPGDVAVEPAVLAAWADAGPPHWAEPGGTSPARGSGGGAVRALRAGQRRGSPSPSEQQQCPAPRLGAVRLCTVAVALPDRTLAASLLLPTGSSSGDEADQPCVVWARVLGTHPVSAMATLVAGGGGSDGPSSLLLAATSAFGPGICTADMALPPRARPTGERARTQAATARAVAAGVRVEGPPERDDASQGGDCAPQQREGAAVGSPRDSEQAGPIGRRRRSGWGQPALPPHAVGAGTNAAPPAGWARPPRPPTDAPMSPLQPAEGAPQRFGDSDGAAAGEVLLLSADMPAPGSVIAQALDGTRRVSAAARQQSASTVARQRAEKAGARSPAARRSASATAARPSSSAQPVTFHARVASSGYGQAGQARRARLLGRGPRGRGASRARAASGVAAARRPTSWAGISTPQPEHSPPDSPLLASPALSVALSASADRLAVGGADGSIATAALPRARHLRRVRVLRAHSSPVHRLRWAHDQVDDVPASRAAGRAVRSRPLLSCAEDAACLWAGRGADAPALRFPAPRGVTCADAAFFYRDRLLITAHGGALRAHAYWLGISEAAQDDVTQLKARSRAVLVHEEGFGSRVGAVACANAALSPVVVCATANHSLTAWDAGAMRRVRTWADGHERPCHALALPAEPPAAATGAPLLSAGRDGVQLWDLRAARPVAWLDAHDARGLHGGAALSPCLTFAAAASACGSAYVYDLRTCGVAARLPCGGGGGGGRAVTDVAFNPCHPQLCAACQNGQAYFFRSDPSAAGEEG